MMHTQMGTMPALGWGRPGSILLLATILLASCGEQAPAPVEAQLQAGTPKAAPSRLAPDIVARAKDVIAQEAKVRSVSFVENDYLAQWQIGVDDDGSERAGYAEYICLMLGEIDARDDRTAVWIVDERRRRAAQGIDVVRSAGLGGVECSTGRHLSA